MKPLLKAAVLLLVASGTVHAQEQYPQPTPAMQAIVDKDVKRKFGDAPADPGPVATDLSAALTKKDIDKVLRKVADWQLARTMAYTDQIWTASVAYAGFMAASEATGDPKYRNAMAKLGKGFNWSLRGAAYPNADDISIGQMYLELYLKEPRPEKIATLRQHLDTLVDLDTLRPGDARLPWWWCDALFMAPPVWLKMWQATGERKYLDYVHEQWKKTYDLLYDQEEHLYARDAGYKDKREGNGKKVFWSRGEGWVMGPGTHAGDPAEGRSAAAVLCAAAARDVGEAGVAAGCERRVARRPARPAGVAAGRDVRRGAVRVRHGVWRQQWLPGREDLPARDREGVGGAAEAHLRGRAPGWHPADGRGAGVLPAFVQLQLWRGRLHAGRGRIEEDGGAMMAHTTKAFRMQLKPGTVDEYKRRHDELWPDLAQALRDAGIFDYSIFLDEETLALFAVLKIADGAPIAELPKQSVMAHWWDYMADLMEVEPDGDPRNRPREWPLRQVFYFKG